MYLGFYANIWCHGGMLKIVFVIHRTMSHTGPIIENDQSCNKLF